MTVANAAPATPMWKLRTNSTTRPMLIRQETIRNTSGVLESPSDRRIPDRRLYSMVAGMPRKITKI